MKAQPILSVPTTVALLLLSGCDALRVSPGQDFGVTVLDASPIQAVGLITVPLRLRITGCAAFEAAVGGGAGRRAIELHGLGGDLFAAEVPVEWLRGEDGGCLYDAASPQDVAGQVVVTCLDAGRSVTADLAIRYGTATRATRIGAWRDQAVIRHLFAHVDPLVPIALAPFAFSDLVQIYPWSSSAYGGFFALPDPDNRLVEPRLAASPARYFVTMGCSPDEACLEVPVSADLKLPGVKLHGSLLGPDGLPALLGGGFAWVPAQVVDMAFAPDGALVVLSQADSDYAAGRERATVVTRVAPEPLQFRHDAQVIGYFPGEEVETRFSRGAGGELSFVTWVGFGGNRSRSVLRVTDGLSVSSRPDPTADPLAGEMPSAGRYHLFSAQLSPDGSSVVADGVYLGPPGGPFLLLPAATWNPGDGVSGGAAWLSDALALWEGRDLRTGSLPSSDVGSVELFDRTPPHGRRFGYAVHALPGVSLPVALHGASAVGDKLVLTTSTGIRVLERSGRVIGGSDPLPCRLAPTAIAVQTGPTQVAVGAGQYLYVFDLAELDDTLPVSPAPSASAP